MKENKVVALQTGQGNFSLRAISLLFRTCRLYGRSSVFRLNIWARRYSPTADNPGAPLYPKKSEDFVGDPLQKNNPAPSNLQSKVRAGLMAGLLLAAVVFATGAFAVEESKNVKEPTVVTSQKMTTDQKARTALFEGNVVTKKGDRTMYADKMLVHYAEEKGGSNIKEIDAEGNVKLVRGNRVVTSKFAVYYAEPEEYIIFTGDPRASEGENVVTGTKITYFMKDDHSIVENSKVFIVSKDRQK